MQSSKKIVVPIALTILAIASGCDRATDTDRENAVVEPTKVVAKYAVFEVALTCDAVPANPFTDASVEAAFVSPSGETVAVPGFYYGGNEWRVRFVPREHGVWRWKTTLSAPGGNVVKEGTFRCEGVAGRGFLRLSKRNCYRMEYADGTPFYPIGIQPGSIFTPGFDGPDKDGKWRSVPAAEWVEAFDGAVNLVRTQLGQGTRSGCAIPLIKPGDRKKNIPPGPVDRYDTDLAAKLDEAYRLHRVHNISQILILYQDMSLWGDPISAFGKGRDLVGYKNVNAPNMPDQERYIRYVVARFGCFVDVWELFNEDSYASDDYLAHLAKVVRDAIRTYALSNGKVTALYVHHFADHGKVYQLPHKLFVETGPGKFRVRWINPADGKKTKTDQVSTPEQFLSVTLPPVKIDAACRIDRIGDAE